MLTALPPIEALLPHRGTMLLLDRALEFSSDMASAEYCPRADAWYADEDGNMPGWFGIELMAQTIGVHVALLKREAGLPVKLGVLLGTRAYRCHTPSFAAGHMLKVRASEVFRDQEAGLAAYECDIVQEETVQATAILKVYEPDDFERFLQK